LSHQYKRPASFAAIWPSAREIAARLGGDTRPDAAGNFSAHCPGPLHKNRDANPSLSVKDAENGRVLLYCFAGCSFLEIVAALEHRGVLLRRGR
jgi:hypothetical protein